MGIISRIFRGKKKKLHGHDLIRRHEAQIISTLKKFDKANIVEIGSQRKAGSTLYISELANNNNFHFITVDLNEITSKAAEKIVKGQNLAFESVNDYGEQFIEKYNEEIHLVYLDAFDVDGDWHSEDLRKWYSDQGNELSNENSWEMHLACAVGIVKKMPLTGYVAFDDVNPISESNELIFDKVNSNWPYWMGKGKTAIPFLLQNGFQVVDNQRGTALFQRVS